MTPHLLKFLPFWRTAEKLYLEKVPSKNQSILKRKKITFFKNIIKEMKILPDKKWYIKFEKMLATK